MAGIVSIVILVLTLGQAREPSYAVGYLILGGLTYGADLLVIWLVVFKRRKASWADIGFRPVKPWVLLVMLPLTLPLLVLTGIVAELTVRLFGDVPGPADQLGVPSAGLSVTDFVCLFAVVVVIGPIVEEIVFRGIFYQVLRARKGIAFGLIVSSLVFSAIHFIPVLIAVFFVMGLAFALVTQLTKSIYPAILLHALNNGVSITLLYLAVN